MTAAIEILFFDDCPNVTLAVDRARQALASVGVSADVRLVRVEDQDDAVRRRFLGSPTVRVNGVDVDDSARAEYGLGCRVYGASGRLEGAPSVALIEALLRR